MTHFCGFSKCDCVYFTPVFYYGLKCKRNEKIRRQIVLLLLIKIEFFLVVLDTPLCSLLLAKTLRLLDVFLLLIVCATELISQENYYFFRKNSAFIRDIFYKLIYVSSGFRAFPSYFLYCFSYYIVSFV